LVFVWFNSGMKKVYSARDPTEAHLVRGFLEARGIEAIVQGEALWAGRGELPLTPDTCPSVWVVHDTDAEHAQELLAARRVRAEAGTCPNCGYDLRGLPQPRCPECGLEFFRPTTWQCPTCGEVIEEQFTACWHCAALDEESDHASGAA
jgi:predicted amidophosphoribosyltransferase